VICATNRRLDEMVAAGEFREDLWYRVNTFEIALPPLCRRSEDVELLARHFAARFAAAKRPGDELFTPEALELLCAHDWPGNVRELANVIEHAMILCDDGAIAPQHLPGRFTAAGTAAPSPRTRAPCSLRELETQAIYDALDRHAGNKPKAAEELGVSLKTLYNKLNQAASLGKTA